MSLSFETSCSDFYSIPLIREHHESYLFYEHYKIFEKNFADVVFTVVSHPVKNMNSGIFSLTKNL